MLINEIKRSKLKESEPICSQLKIKSDFELLNKHFGSIIDVNTNFRWMRFIYTKLSGTWTNWLQSENLNRSSWQSIVCTKVCDKITKFKWYHSQTTQANWITIWQTIDWQSTDPLISVFKQFLKRSVYPFVKIIWRVDANRNVERPGIHSEQWAWKFKCVINWIWATLPVEMRTKASSSVQINLGCKRIQQFE